MIHPKTVFEALKNATKPESKEVSFLEKHSHHRHHPRHQKCAGIFQLENLSLGPTNSAAKVIFYLKKKKIAWLHGDVQESNRSHLLCRTRDSKPSGARQRLKTLRAVVISEFPSLPRAQL